MVPPPHNIASRQADTAAHLHECGGRQLVHTLRCLRRVGHAADDCWHKGLNVAVADCAAGFGQSLDCLGLQAEARQ